MGTRWILPIPWLVATAFAPTIADDCDGNGRSDAVEIAASPTLDCDGDGMLDACERSPAFGWRGEIGFSTHARALAVGDLDGDGRSDLVVGGRPSGQSDVEGLSLLLATDDGLTLHGRLDVARVDTVALGDVDQDGDLDLAAASTATDLLYLLFNDGHGVFSLGLTFGPLVTVAPFHVYLVDLDGDGAPELIASDADGDRVAVFRNSGGGGFPQRPDRTLTTQGGLRAFIDLDADGLPEILSSHDARNESWIRRNRGGLSFDSSRPFDDQAGSPVREIRAIHADDDGRIGLVLLERDAVTILRDDGGPELGLLARFPLPVERSLPPSLRQSIAAGDVNLDGRPDIVVMRERAAWTLLAKPDGSFAQPTDSPIIAWPNACVLLDADGDGDQDLVVNDPIRPASIAFNDGAGRFGAYDPDARSPQRLESADFDGDGDVDLATISSQPPTLSFRSNDGSGRLSTVTSIALRGPPAELAAVDLDADDVDELVLACGNEVSVWIARDEDWLDLIATITLDTQPQQIASGDFNGDGDTDIAVTGHDWLSRSTDRIEVLLGDGSGGFFARLPTVLGVKLRGITAADLDGDGYAELLLAAAGSLAILGNRRDGSFTALQVVPESAEIEGSVVARDFDADGDVDVITLGDRLDLWENDGSGALERTWRAPRRARALRHATVGDLDANGRLDLVMTSWHETGRVFVAMDNGRGAFAISQVAVLGHDLLDVALGDFDLDGATDLAVVHRQGGLTGLSQVAPPTGLDRNHDGLLDSCGESSFIRGDIDASGTLDLSDAVAALRFLFAGAAAPLCANAVDVDDNGRLELSDPVALLGWLFRGEAPPPEPFPDCGEDRAQSLGCVGFAPCS